MLRFRSLIVWLIMAAIPLQGMAAASMLFCGMGAKNAVLATAVAQQHDRSSGAHATNQHDHSMHSHAQVQVKKVGDAKTQQLPDASHKCGVCASCCTSMAITQFSRLPMFASNPQAEPAEPVVLIHARPSQVLDKPPRA